MTDLNPAHCPHGIREAWCVVCKPELAPPLGRREAVVVEGICARGCGRVQDQSMRRPEGDLGRYCQQCRRVGRARVKAAGGNPFDAEVLLAELRRIPTRGVLPGVDSGRRR